MYSKEESRQIRKEFWICFGIFMQKHIPESSPKIKWVNYNSGVKNILVKTDVLHKEAFFSIDIVHKDESVRKLNFEQFRELELVLNSSFEHELEWQEYVEGDSGTYSRIIIRYAGRNLYKKDDWGDLFRFLESCLVSFDSFWAEFNELFKELEELSF